jgi:hypothetical protein
MPMPLRDELNPRLPNDVDPTPDSLELAIASFRGSPPGA